MGLGAVQLLGGTRAEPGMTADATVDSHVRFMGSAMAACGLGWLDTAREPEPDLQRMRVLAGVMAAGGMGRLITRATIGRPTRFHDFLLTTELATPVVVELVRRYDRGFNPAR